MTNSIRNMKKKTIYLLSLYNVFMVVSKQMLMFTDEEIVKLVTEESGKKTLKRATTEQTATLNSAYLT